MSDTFEINEFDQVVPYTNGRKCMDTRAWRDASEFELEQRDKIQKLEKRLNAYDSKNNMLDSALEEANELLYDMTCQHWCGCEHPACNRCSDDKHNAEHLKNFYKDGPWNSFQSKS